MEVGGGMKREVEREEVEATGLLLRPGNQHGESFDRPTGTVFANRNQPASQSHEVNWRTFNFFQITSCKKLLIF